MPYVSKATIVRFLFLLTFLIVLIFLLSKVNRYFPLLIQRKAPNISLSRNSFIKKRVQIVFLKTHKTGGSTVTNILQRYGLAHRLNFALPRKKPGEERYNYIGDFGSTLYLKDLIPLPDGESYEVLCSHVIYNHQAFRHVFNGRTFYFTILREPWDQFVSAVNYYGLADGYINNFLTRQVKNPLSDYLASPKSFEPSEVFLSFTNNRQLFDLGFPFNRFDPRNETQVLEYVKFLQSTLDFVMITEYFDESLILLKRKLNLTLSDIMYIPQNTRRVNKNFTLNEKDRNNFNNWNKGDIILHKTFKRTIETRMQNDESLKDEVKYFRKIMHDVIYYCDSDVSISNITISKSRWNEVMVFTSNDCHLFKLDELTFLNKLKGLED